MTSEREQVVDDRDGEHERAQPQREALPTSASIPSANAVSVDIATPHPCAEPRPALNARKIATGTTIPNTPAATGSVTAPPVAQLAHVELAARLEAETRKNSVIRPAVQPVAQVVREAVPADADGQRRVPDAFVRRRVGVHPDERGDGGGEEDGRAAGLRREEAAQWRLEVAHPGGAA